MRGIGRLIPGRKGELSVECLGFDSGGIGSHTGFEGFIGHTMLALVSVLGSRILSLGWT
jgi:hypothetical protein